jgi:hypothetical protein
VPFMNSTTSCPLISRSMRSCTGSFIGFVLHSQELAGSVIVVGLRAPRALAPSLAYWG